MGHRIFLAASFHVYSTTPPLLCLRNVVSVQSPLAQFVSSAFSPLLGTFHNPPKQGLTGVIHHSFSYPLPPSLPPFLSASSLLTLSGQRSEQRLTLVSRQAQLLETLAVPHHLHATLCSAAKVKRHVLGRKHAGRRPGAQGEGGREHEGIGQAEHQGRRQEEERPGGHFSRYVCMMKGLGLVNE